ncbi:histone family protein [Candidatus Woesearchaeota archaeon]|nr:histone family protein [Candidatus Woesearchaeota archaeon]
MGRKSTTIPKAPVGRILMQAGAKRVSMDAMQALSEVLTEYAHKIGSQAVQLARHGGRKTIHEEDIKLAAKQ